MVKQQDKKKLSHRVQLNQAADAYAEEGRELSGEMLDQDEAFDARSCGFTSGANWEQEQMIPIAVEAYRVSCFLHDAITGRCAHQDIVRKCDGNCIPMQRFKKNLESLILDDK